MANKSDYNYLSCKYFDSSYCKKDSSCFGKYMIVPNKDDNNISIIITEKVKVDGNEALLAINGGLNSANFYAASIDCQKEFAVGDRGNSRIIVYDSTKLAKKREVLIDNGVFHIWYYERTNQLWVTCDIDKTVVVICTLKWVVIKSIPIPNEFKDNYTPHDITVTYYGAVVTLLDKNVVADEHKNNSFGDGYLIRYDFNTFKETGRLKVAADPHVLCFGRKFDYLYSAAQGGVVYQINPESFEIGKYIEFEGAHGLWLTNDRKTLFVTNITSVSGENAIGVLCAKTLKIRSFIDSILPNPHNLMLTLDNRTLYITHTELGKVSVYYLTSYFVSQNTAKLDLFPGSMGIMRYPLDILSYNPTKHKKETSCDNKIDKYDKYDKYPKYNHD